MLAQAVQEAQARAAPATIAVVDRAGNVLGGFPHDRAPAPRSTFPGTAASRGGLEGVAVLASALAAIAKAITGAYLSSEGNAFSTRTASQIVQENFNPGEIGSPGGPLFGVQFSQLSCSDLVRRPGDGSVGPKRSPLGPRGRSRRPAALQERHVVGGIGVIADGIYSLDLDIVDIDASVDELIAVAGARGFDAPADRRADRITADGRTFRYVDSRGDRVAIRRRRSFAAASGLRRVRRRSRLLRRGRRCARRHRLRHAASGFRAGHDDAGVRRARRLRAGRRGRRQSLSADRRHRRPDDAGRGDAHPRRGAEGRQPRARADPPPARLAGAGEHHGGRHQRRDPRLGPHAGCAGVRHRRRAAEGAHRVALLAAERRPPIWRRSARRTT